MYSPQTRAWGKRVIGMSRVKLVFARITLTRYTTLYCILALFTCLTLVILQARTFVSNTEGLDVIQTLVDKTHVNTTTEGFSFLQNSNVVICHNIPDQPDSNCTTLVKGTNPNAHVHVRDLPLLDGLHLEARDEDDNDNGVNLQQCAISLLWLGEVLTDARREDLVTLAYQLWLLSMSMTTLLNESLPHLFASLAARALATGWAAFRVHGNQNLYTEYQHVIAVGACHGFDPMGDWWSQDGTEVAALVFNALDFVLSALISYKLFKVYASQTFSRVGASGEVHGVYKIVLSFSVVLQLAGFFILASTSLWIGKISLSPIRSFVDDFPLNIAILVVTAVFEIPWLVLGWMSVRRESKVLFILFSITTLVLVAMAIIMVMSPLYRFVLSEWSFYATISIAGDVLLLATSSLAIVCRLHFGKGLAHFLRVTDMLDDGDFTPVTFTKGDGVSPADDKKFTLDPELAVLGYSYPMDRGTADQSPGGIRKMSAFSMILSNDQAENNTIHLSSTPALFTGPAGDNSRLGLPMHPHAVVKPVVRSTSLASSSNVVTVSEPQPKAKRALLDKAPAEPTQPAKVVTRSRSGSVPPAQQQQQQAAAAPAHRARAHSVSKPTGNFF
ncbi:hypothetical protein HMN09_00178800 [Mycena chlorophos]|uniref:Transmembrane protein n=1 Tax=Mycena chlorophos TaxID=658473 RepID=A0A8H6TQF7_MYCCL|nr:hypothetical protein HMN09_00178800 [Mycena chlorophos]